MWSMGRSSGVRRRCKGAEKARSLNLVPVPVSLIVFVYVIFAKIPPKYSEYDTIIYS